MSKPKYEIGQPVWIAHTGYREQRAVCEDCNGATYLTVILGSGEQVTIGCQGCARGYENAKGYNIYSEHFAEPKQTEIDGIERTHDGWQYTTTPRSRGENHKSGYHTREESEVFLSEQEAIVAAEKMAEERTAEELGQLKHKYNQHRSWAWHVSYYRKQIKDAKKTIERAERLLDWAKTKAKEPSNA